MPIPVAQRALTPERLYGFAGVNLRRDRLALEDAELARAINADLHSQVGTAQQRQGSLQVQTIGVPVRQIQTVQGVRYLVGNSGLWVPPLQLLTVEPTGTVPLVAQRPLNDSTTWTFVASGGARKLSGSTITNWGIAAPTVTPTVGTSVGTGLTGVYQAAYSFVRMNGSSIAHESSISPVSVPQTLMDQALDVGNLLASTDPQVTGKRLYRTVNGGARLLFDQAVALGTTLVSTTTADSALGAVAPNDNDPPPSGVTQIVGHQGHIFLLDTANDLLRWSKRYQPESVPSNNYIFLGSTSDPMQCAVSLVGLLGVFTLKTKYRVLGNDTSGFVELEAPSSRGTPAPQTVCMTERGCFFVARDGVFLTNFVSPDEELSGRIAPLFEGQTVNGYRPINWTYAHTMALAYWNQRLYFAYPSGDQGSPDMLAVYSFQTQQWYFWQLAARSLYAEEETGLLLAGLDGGEVLRLETGRTDINGIIPMVLEPATRAGGDPLQQKRMEWCAVEATFQTGTLIVAVFVDEMQVAGKALTAQSPRRFRVGGVLGSTWRVRLTYLGEGPCTVRGVEMLWLPVEKV